MTNSLDAGTCASIAADLGFELDAADNALLLEVIAGPDGATLYRAAHAFEQNC